MTTLATAPQRPADPGTTETTGARVLRALPWPARSDDPANAEGLA